MRFIDPSAMRPLKVVLDGANGMAGPMIGPLLERLPIAALPYHLDPDGSFPNGEPNPLLEENRQFIIEQVRGAAAPTSASPGTATPTAASSSTTPASSCPAT